MTSKTSLFNKGIYKSTIRRFLWGSILYFILLFLSTGMAILLNEDPNQINAYSSVGTHSTMLSVDYMMIPMLLSMVVPTVVGLLVFRFIHSRKASVFVHSLPVKREANYVSTVLAALTLMVLPVILNTVVLIIMSVTVFSVHFSVGNCFLWMLLNILALFIMFSAVCFVSVLTGNSFAMIGLNILFHTIALIISGAFTMVCEIFLYGFAGEADLLEKVFDKTFLMRVPIIMTDWAYSNAQRIELYRKDLILFSVIAVVLYIISGFLYKKRRIETAEDVAGFNCLNAIFKYLVTFVGAIGTFAIVAYSIYVKPVSVWLLVFILSAVIYFGVEMLLKKTFRVWKSYKGYISFAIAFAAMMCMFAFTEFFGFETYIPDKAKIESVTLYDNYYCEEGVPASSDAELVERVIKEHGKLLENRKILLDEEYVTGLYIEYLLKNGRSVRRLYRVSEDELHDVMNSLYESQDYKKKIENIFKVTDKIVDVRLDNELYIEKEKALEFVNCIKKDVMELGYNEIYSGSREFSVEISYIPSKKQPKEEIDHVAYEYISFGANHKHTMKWISDNGYWDEVALENKGIIYIVRDWEDLPFVDGDSFVEYDVEGKFSFIKIEEEEELQKIVDFCNYTHREYVRKNDRYQVFRVNGEGDLHPTNITTISMEELRKLFPEKNLDKLN